MTSPSLPGALKAHVSLNVHDVDASVAFYQSLFGLPPAKHYHHETTVHSVLVDDRGRDSRATRSGYAKFDLDFPPLNLVLNQVAHSRGDALSHLGIQVSTTEDVEAIRERFVGQGRLPRDERQVSCCYAKQDKIWVADPDGNEWEFFVVLEHLSPEQLDALDRRGVEVCAGGEGASPSCAAPADPSASVESPGSCRCNP